MVGVEHVIRSVFQFVQEKPVEVDKSKLSKKKLKKINRLSVAELKQVTITTY
jgi:hypothetical protein